jgi:bacteriocin-like protein
MEKKQRTGKRVKIKDLPKNLKISEEELNQIQGGVTAFQGLVQPAEKSGNVGMRYMIVIRGRF